MSVRLEIEYKMTAAGSIRTTYAERLCDVTKGFWVDKDGKLTKATDCRMFILPHLINYILKL